MKDKENITTIYKLIIDDLSFMDKNLDDEYYNNLDKIYKLFQKKDGVKDIISYELILYILFKCTNFLKDIENLSIYLLKTIIIINNLEFSETINRKPYLKTINFKCNGDSLFNKQQEEYFNNITPYKKLNTSLPEGNYFMTFSLNPEEKNPTGHLNFNLFEESVLITTCNDNIKDRKVQINIISKEYNILRILGGMGNLTWSKV